jgi:uncharacterized protein YdbL (DUF1318 family)
MRRRTILVLVASLAALAAGSPDEELGQLRARAEKRYPLLQQLKTTGSIGETYLGYLALPPNSDADDKARALMADENTDRKQVYALLAEKEQTTPEKVAERAAKRNFARAKSGEYLLFPNGQWQRKP